MYREREEHSLRLDLETGLGQPTHEPTMFDINVFPNEHEPTNEPTRFTMHEEKQPTHEITDQPTIFGHTGEPTVFGRSVEPTIYGQSGEPTTYGQSGEPTVYGQSGEPTVYGGTGEPTLFNQHAGAHTSEPTIFYHDTLGSGEGSEPTNEPTVFFVDHESGNNEEHSHHHDDHHHSRTACGASVECTGGFCNFDEGSHGYCESCSDFTSVEHCKSDGLPDKGADACVAECFEAPTPSPSQPPHLHTWAPTQEGSFAPTSDPTIFPTPEPTPGI